MTYIWGKEAGSFWLFRLEDEGGRVFGLTKQKAAAQNVNRRALYVI